MNDLARIGDRVPPDEEVEVTVRYRGVQYRAKGIPTEVQIDNDWRNGGGGYVLVNRTFRLELTRADVVAEKITELKEG